jgi:hypothetical protein
VSPKKPAGDRKENRASAKDKVDQVVKALGLTKEERSKLHRNISGNDYMSYQDILQEGQSIKSERST